MGVDVTWENENGEILASLGDNGNCVMKLAEMMPNNASHCLAYIDEYGDTTFNRIQVRRLMQELAEIPKNALDARDQEFLERIRDLAEKCVDEMHTYLKFSGD